MKIAFKQTIVIAILATVARTNIVNAMNVALDTASNVEYQDGWDNGENGGFGFGPWQLVFDGVTAELDPVYSTNSHFIDGANVGPLIGNGLDQDHAFGMTTSRGKDTVAASRDFSRPLTADQTFSVELDGSAFEIGQFPNIGNRF